MMQWYYWDVWTWNHPNNWNRIYKYGAALDTAQGAENDALANTARFSGQQEGVSRLFRYEPLSRTWTRTLSIWRYVNGAIEYL